MNCCNQPHRLNAIALSPKSSKLRVEFITSSQEARIAQQPIAIVISQHTSSSCAPPSSHGPIRVELHQPSFDGVHTQLVKDCDLRVPVIASSMRNHILSAKVPYSKH
ncbi:hypothetical protein GOBAR_AA18548 [Gossypium barbadense]|uniref:Uncharacterized protein n=1 Tax=Gossypium barbadense TaxID=3634 RepID=A0A2P5XFJ5_GOSBA|nr:hypothetical protein GOBAR_AA18548 [Gossypium barbadense]